jgi:hypothetical protein
MVEGRVEVATPATATMMAGQVEVATTPTLGVLAIITSQAVLKGSIPGLYLSQYWTWHQCPISYLLCELPLLVIT